MYAARGDFEGLRCRDHKIGRHQTFNRAFWHGLAGGLAGSRGGTFPEPSGLELAAGAGFGKIMG